MVKKIFAEKVAVDGEGNIEFDSNFEYEYIYQINNELKYSIIPTKIGDMLVVSDNNILYLTKFIDKLDIQTEIANIKKRTGSNVVNSSTSAIDLFASEIQEFLAKCKKIKASFCMIGTQFQILSWKETLKLHCGETQSYREQSERIGKPLAYRAVAGANRQNSLMIIIPCHRIIHNDGALDRYSGGVERKKWLIEHERNQA